MQTHSLSSRFLDQVAISMAIICAIHCLITPVLLVGLPILATTFWVDANFHLWMILLVIPTTTLAVWSGCRRHRDKWVISIAAVGLGLLSVALANERYAKAAARSDSASAVQLSSGPNARLAIESNAAACAACSTCVPSSKEGGGAAGQTTTYAGLPWHLVLNVAGGLLLATAHTRNFLLCRRDRCQHSNRTHRS